MSLISDKKTSQYVSWIIYAMVLIIIVFSGVSKLNKDGHINILGNSSNKETDSTLLANSIKIYSELELKKLEDNKSFFNSIFEGRGSTISIGWVGDIVPVEISDTNKKINLFGHIEELLGSPDIMSGNLEGVITKNISSKCFAGRENCFTFSGNKKFLDILSTSGFDVLNIANNHSYDFGDGEFLETQKEVIESGLIPVGFKNEIKIKRIKNTNIAFVSFAGRAGTSSFLETVKMQSVVQRAKQEADIVIAFIHAGAEGENFSNLKDEDEIYLGENRGNTKQQAHIIIDAGADAVFGSGPHVLRGIEIYKDKPIAYSLGNFYTNNKLSKKGLLMLSAILVVSFDKSGQFKDTKITSLYIDDYGIPQIDESGRAKILMNKLSKEDFGDDGLIVY